MAHDRRYTRLTKVEIDTLVIGTSITFPGGAVTVVGDETVTGNLIFTAASAKIIPGVTSLLIRNTADSATNIGITDAGVVTVRAGVAVTAGGVVITAGGLKSAEATGNGIGYSTGAGGTQTQLTDITTTVTLNKLTGTITTVSATLAAGVDASFTLSNSTIAATDTVIVHTKSYGGSADGIPICKVQSVAAGNCVINVHNQGAVALDAVVVMTFAVFKAVAA